MFLPILRMQDRVEVARQESDTAFFLHLMYFGELIVKLAISSLVATVADDSDRNAYRLQHGLVRADGIGEWVKALDDILVGPASQKMIDGGRHFQRELTQKSPMASWQYEAVCALDACLRELDHEREGLPLGKLDGRRWFAMFAELRNRTRGHGAPGAGKCSDICGHLQKSIDLIINNFTLFARPWVYLRRNLSSKYRVTALGDDLGMFGEFKSQRSNVPDGVYADLGEPVRVNLLYSDPDATDFFLPNGNFNGKTFEALSYISDVRMSIDAQPFLAPAGYLPGSETEGLGCLEVQGNTFGNLPPAPRTYIPRPALERELRDRLLDARHPVITLLGRGGIGKTSLALSVLQSLADEGHFGAMFWFSARDIDLLPEGPKQVRPHLLDENDVARELVKLLEPEERHSKEFKKLTYLAQMLSDEIIGKPILFTFDNFETVRNPVELFAYLNTYIRLPNKILITTRFREFKGDYPVEVVGMSEREFAQLTSATAADLGINSLITREYERELYKESDGHPYVAKVLLGEVAKAGKLTKIERIIAARDEILDALFERTYAGLSPSAKLVFLTLCNWRSTIPQVAIEAVMLRETNERLDVDAAIEELRRSSFIETVVADKDSESFMTVPLAASIFGRRKLAVSPLKVAVEANTAVLLYFGAGQRTDIRHGIAPRVSRFFSRVAEEVSADASKLAVHLPTLQFLARRHTEGWLLLASLYEEVLGEGGLDKAKEAIRNFLETAEEPSQLLMGWERLAILCRRTQDYNGELQALVEIASIPKISFYRISSAVNRWNQLSRQQFIPMASDERQILARKLVNIMESRADEMDATDCSRVAWVCLSLGDEAKAWAFTCRGLELEPDNEYCQRLEGLPRFEKFRIAAAPSVLSHRN